MTDRTELRRRIAAAIAAAEAAGAAPADAADDTPEAVRSHDGTVTVTPGAFIL